MAQTIKTGLIGTEDVLSNEKVVDMSERVYKLQEDETQFTTMLMELSSKKATREVIDWLEEEYRQRVSLIGAASATSAATAIEVTTGEGNTIFAVHDVVRVMSTGEALLVTSVSANSIGVTRTWGGVAAASAQSGASLMIVGNAYPAGASSGTTRYVQRVRGFNYLQESREPIHFTWVQEAAELYGGREPGKELRRAAINHKRGVESTLFFGARDQDTSASPDVRGSAGGAVEFISTNIDDAGGALTPAEMDLFLEDTLPFAEDPVLFAAPRVASALSQMYRGVWSPNTGGIVKYGVKVNAYLDTTFGKTIPIVVKKEWSDLLKTSTNYGTWAFLIDMDAVRLRPLRGYTIGTVRRNIGEPSATATVSEFYSPFSIEFGKEARHGILKGVTSYAAS
jgi:hypothetical protein